MTFEEEKAIWDRYRGQKGSNGRALCTWCGTEVPKGRKSWCSDGCVDQFRQLKERSYHNRKAAARDQGICQSCGIDIQKVSKLIRDKMFADTRWYGRGDYTRSLMREKMKGLGVDIPSFREAHLEYYRRLGWPSYGVAEEFDHIVELSDGGPNTLDNLQTLCSRCHKRKTSGFAAKRAERAREVKKSQDLQLQLINPLLAALVLLALAGCSSIENHDSYWNKTLRDPLHYDSSIWLQAKTNK
jgi:5-methylcytosine-specific restriction enzyme A